MVLFIDGVCNDVLCTKVGFGVQNYDSAFELLAKLVAEDWILHKATLFDQAYRMHIPVEAFDGQPIQHHILALQQQWAFLLASKPIARFNLLETDKLKDWLGQLDAYYDALLAHLGKMIFLLETRKIKLASQPDKAWRAQVLQQCESLLVTYRKLFQQTENERERNQTRLLKLEAE